MSYIPNDTYKLNDTSIDAWGRPKSYTDKSLLHGIWTFDVVDTLWRIFENNTLVPLNDSSTKVYSENGMLKVEAGANLNDSAYLLSKRSPRYQPNRGHLYSTALGLPNPTANAERDFGIFNNENGVFFRLKSDGNLYACIKSDGIMKKEELITLPAGIDISKGNVYDIQFQWRGVGDYNFFIGVEGKVRLIHTIIHQNLLDEELSMMNPALPICYKSTNLGDDAKIWVGCADITTEGGEVANKVSSFIATGQDGVSLGSNQDYAVLAIQIPETYLGKINTRDCVLNRITTSCNNEAVINIYYSKIPFAFNGTIWSDAGRENVKYAIGNNISFDPVYAQSVFSVRTEQDVPFKFENPSPDSAPRYISAGDYIVIMFDASGGNIAHCTIEWSEEV